MSTTQALKTRIDMAMGREPVDLLVTNVKVLDVFSGTIFESPVAIGQGEFIGFGEYEAREVLDAGGRTMLPGLIDAHVHLESSMVSPRQFAACVLPRGTTTVIADPHEIANVLGADGIRYMLEATRALPLDVRIMLPSCVPATPFENAGAVLNAADLAPLLGLHGVLGLGEVMNYPGVIHADPQVLDKLLLAHQAGRMVDGHSPGVSGRELTAYAAAGIRSDHECSTPEELAERVRLGLYVLLREGSAARNLTTLLTGVTPENARRCLLCTDDREPADLLARGHIDHSLRLAVRSGLDPVTAVRMATLNTAECYGLAHKGAIAPAYQADFVLMDDLYDFVPQQVYVAGQLVAAQGRMIADLPDASIQAVSSTVHLAPLGPDSLELRLDRPRANVIGLIPDSLVTRALLRDVILDGNGRFLPHNNPGLSKLAVIERHKATGNVGLGIIEGYGVRGGAIATTIAHDSHNIVVAGDNDADMLTAVADIQAMGGGVTLCRAGEIIARLPLPIAGLMSDRPACEVAAQLGLMLQAAHEQLGVESAIQPFMTLSFLSLPVIPELKLTDTGLFDVRSFRHIGVCATS
ncbi:MAG: adenine deaminase [Proteobacteria bacterium]|nr:adenine deaminase [Pseudomonadota bacterium]